MNRFSPQNFNPLDGETRITPEGQGALLRSLADTYRAGHLKIELENWNESITMVGFASQLPPGSGFRAQQLANIGIDLPVGDDKTLPIYVDGVIQNSETGKIISRGGFRVGGTTLSSANTLEHAQAVMRYACVAASTFEKIPGSIQTVSGIGHVHKGWSFSRNEGISLPVQMARQGFYSAISSAERIFSMKIAYQYGDSDLNSFEVRVPFCVVGSKSGGLLSIFPKKTEYEARISMASHDPEDPRVVIEAQVVNLKNDKDSTLIYRGAVEPLLGGRIFTGLVIGSGEALGARDPRAEKLIERRGFP